MNSNFNNLIFYDSSSDQPYRPPQQENLEQWLTGSEKQVSYFKNDFVDCGLTYEPQGLGIVGECCVIPNTLHTGTILSKENLFKLGVTAAGAFRVLIGTGTAWTTIAISIAPYSVGNLYHVEYRFDYSMSGNSSYVKINGTTVWSSSVQYTFTSSDRKVVIGSYQSVGGSITSEKFDGYIFDVKLSNGVDSSWWKLDEESGSIAYDSIGSINGAITDDTPNTIHDYKLLPDNLGGGAYGLHDLTQQVVDVAIADRPVFNNEGLDWVALGRPSWLSKLRPSVDKFTIRFSFAHNMTEGAGYIFALSTGTAQQLSFSVRSDLSGGASIGDNDGYIPNVIYPDRFEIGVWYDVVVSCDTDFVYTYVNGILAEKEPPGTFVSAENLFFGGREDGSIANFEGQTGPIEFYEGVNLGTASCAGLIPIEKFSLDNFDGGQVVGSVAGTIGTITNGLPFTIQDKGIATKYNLNAHGLVTTTGFAGDEWLIRAEISALHNNTTIFTTENEDPIRDRIYSDTTVLTAAQIDANNRKVRR